MMVLAWGLYVLFAAVIAFLLKTRKVGFWAMFFLSLIFTPLVVAIMGLIFTKDHQTKEDTHIQAG